MNQNVRIALIGAVAGIITALITAGTTVWANENRNEDENRQQAEIDAASTATAQTAELPEVAMASTHEVGYVGPLAATVTSDDGVRTDQDGPVKADICVLTGVASYGGATKGCTLTKEDSGWVLVANARKATSRCLATCFDLRPRPNGTPSSDGKGNPDLGRR
jgi:hypothetical protein